MTGLEPGVSWSPRPRSLLLCGGPAIAAVLLWLLAAVMPQTQVWGHILQSLMLSVQPWLMVLGLFTSLIVAWRGSNTWIYLLAATAYGVAVGPPPVLADWLDSSELLTHSARASSSVPSADLVVVSANLDAFSPGPPGAAAALAALQPDLLLVIERRAERVPGLDRVADNYTVPMDRASHGHAIHCRPGLACDAAITPEFGSPSSRMPMGLVHLELVAGGKGDRLPVCMMSVHAPPPAPLNATGLLPYWTRVAAAIRGGQLVAQWGPCMAGDAVVVLGDFNTVPGSPSWKLLTAGGPAGTGLQGAERVGRLWRASWPAGGGWPRLPFFALDNVRLSPQLRVTDLRRVAIPGADHLALVFRLGVR